MISLLSSGVEPLIIRLMALRMHQTSVRGKLDNQVK